MSKHQLSWNRSYRQALELLARQQVDLAYQSYELINRNRADARLMFVADLYGVGGTPEDVLADLAQLRIDAKEWMDRVEGRT